MMTVLCLGMPVRAVGFSTGGSSIVNTTVFVDLAEFARVQKAGSPTCRRSVTVRGHFLTEPAAMDCFYLLVTRSRDARAPGSPEPQQMPFHPTVRWGGRRCRSPTNMRRAMATSAAAMSIMQAAARQAVE